MTERGEGSTVAAICTAPGAAGIAVVRLSGPRAHRIADALCPHAATKPSDLPAGSFRLFRLRDPADGSALDEALVLSFRAPRSFTGEDTVELQVHGGREAPGRVLDALLRLGAEAAGPGEFSRRAFLNGKLPLDRAEAVMDLVAAQGGRAARIAAEQLSGTLGARVDEAYDELLALCADLEATLDFDEEEASELPAARDFQRRVSAIGDRLEALLATAREGRLLREGALVVLCGPPNAGKSTLFNALLGASRAIVSPEAGTTRDSLEETLLLDGVPVRLVDTAGLRDARGEIEREGIRRAKARIASADLVLQLVPADAEEGDADEAERTEVTGGAHVLRVLSKADLLRTGSARHHAYDVTASATAPDGLCALRAAMRESLGVAGAARGGAGGDVAVGARHAALLREALARLREAAEVWRADGGADAAVPAAMLLRTAAESLGRITGRTYSEELLDSVFSRFCVGK